MENITAKEYEIACKRIEELLPLVDDNTSLNDSKVTELKNASETVIEYEKLHSL